MAKAIVHRESPKPAAILSVTLELSVSEAQLIRDLIGATVPVGDIEADVWAIFDQLDKTFPKVKTEFNRIEAKR